MNRKQRIHELLSKMSDEVFEYIREKKTSYKDGWVPAAHIKTALELNFVCVPKNNKQLSGARESHPRALRELDVTVSRHPAPIVQP